MLKILKKHDIDALEEALITSIEKAHQHFTCECEKICFCTCLFANYFSNSLSQKLLNDKICKIFWIKIINEFNYDIKVNILSIVLKENKIDKELLQKITLEYCPKVK